MPIGYDKQSYIPRRDIALQIGYCSTTEAKVLACSLSNATASLVVDGVGTYPITWTTIGADVSTLPNDAWGVHAEYNPVAPTEAGFIAHMTIPGLSALTKYTWTLSQTGGADTTGSFYTKPADAGTEPFSLWMISCDNGQGGGGSGNGYADGGYDHIAAYIADSDTLPLVAIFHIDDIGYTASAPGGDASFNDYLSGDATRTGLSNYSDAVTYGTEFCALFPHFNRMNLLGPATANDIPASWLDPITPPVDTYIRSFSGYARDYCYRNSSFIFSWGDWEVKNDMGWNFDPMENVTGSPTNREIYDNARSAWDKWFVPMMPPDFNVSAADNSGAIDPTNYVVDFGPVRICAYDGITNGLGDIPDGDAGHIDPVSTTLQVIGSNQLDDMLTQFGSAHAFKFMMSTHGIGYGVTPQGEISSGPQHPLKQHCPVEFAQLFDAVALSDSLNGTSGHFTSFHGDTHYSLATEYSNNFAFYTGSINKSGGHPRSSIIEGEVYDAVTTVFKAAPLGNTQTSSIRIDVFPGDDRYIKVHMYGTELSGTDGLLETFILRDQQADNFFSRLSEIDMAGDISFSEGTAIPEITAIDKMGIDDSDAGAGNVNCSVTPLALSEYINGVGAYNGQGKVDSLKTYADHAALAHGYTADTCTAFNTIKDVVGAKDLVVDTGDATFEQIYRTGDGLSASYLAGAGNEIDLVAGDFSSGGTGGYIAFAVITGASSVDGVGIGSPNGSGDGYSGFDIGRGVNYMYPGTANGLAGTDYVTFPALGVVDAEWDGKVQAYCEYFDPETAGIWKFGMHENLSNPVIVEGTRSGNGGTWTDRPAPGPFMKFSRDHAFKFHALYVYHLGTSAVPVDTKIKEILRALISSRGTVPPERMKDLT